MAQPPRDPMSRLFLATPEAQNASISVWLIFVHFSFIFCLNPIRDIPIAISACCALGRSHIINYNSVRKARLAPHRWRHFRAVPEKVCYGQKWNLCKGMLWTKKRMASCGSAPKTKGIPKKTRPHSFALFRRNGAQLPARQHTAPSTIKGWSEN